MRLKRASTRLDTTLVCSQSPIRVDMPMICRCPRFSVFQSPTMALRNYGTPSTGRNSPSEITRKAARVQYEVVDHSNQLQWGQGLCTCSNIPVPPVSCRRPRLRYLIHPGFFHYAAYLAALEHANVAGTWQLQSSTELKMVSSCWIKRQ